MAKNEPNTPVPNQPKLVYNRAGRRAKRRTEKESSCWAYAPGNIYLLKQGERLIGSLGIDGGPALKQVDYVRAAWAEGTQVVYIHPTSDKDLDAIAMTRNGSRVSANLSDDFMEWGLALAVNTKSRFRMTLAQQGDLVYPAVKIDVSVPIETRTVNKKKSKRSGARGQETAQTPETAVPSSNGVPKVSGQ